MNTKVLTCKYVRIASNNYFAASYQLKCSSHRYQSIITFRQPLEKDSGNYSITAISGSQTAKFGFTLQVTGKINPIKIKYKTDA